MPTWTPLNVRLAGDGVRVPDVTPMPDNATSTEVLDPLTLIDRLRAQVRSEMGEAAE